MRGNREGHQLHLVTIFQLACRAVYDLCNHTLDRAAGGKLLVATAGGIRVPVVKASVKAGADIIFVPTLGAP
jgi:bifunctional enzyme Fae/Hps